MASTRRAYAGGAQSTTTTSAIASSGTTSFTITAYTGWPYGSDPFFIVVEPGTASEEKILVTRTGSTDTTINIASDSERGQDGTSAVAHSSGSIVFPVFTALDADEANAVASIITADTANSRIGIGTATPARTFEVQSSSGAVANFEGDAATAYITLTSSGTTSNTQVRVGAVGDEMRLYAGGSEQVRIDSSGNVGINDTNPSYTLDVDGDINATGDVRIAGNPTAMVLLDDQSFTGFGGVTLGGLSSDFTHYMVQYFGYQTAANVTALSLRFRRSGSTITTSDYSYGINGCTMATAAAFQLGAQSTTQIRLGTQDGDGCIVTMFITLGFGNEVGVTWQHNRGKTESFNGAGHFDDGSAVTGLYIFRGSGNTIMRARVYGLRN